MLYVYQLIFIIFSSSSSLYKKHTTSTLHLQLRSLQTTQSPTCQGVATGDT